MARTALIIGGTGQIGRAIGINFLAHGWQVKVAHRGGHRLDGELVRLGAEEVMVDRDDAASLAQALGRGADAVVDCVAYTPEHARQLLSLQSSTGAIAVVSSASVYCDEAGRTLDEAAQNGFPEFGQPIDETQPTVAPGPETYSTKKVAIERLLLDNARVPVKVLRPCAIHGPGSAHPREWWFLKRALDGRRRVPVAYEGLSRFHTTATANMAEVCRLSLEAGGSRILNIGDPEPPTAREIGEAIANAIGHHWEIVGLEGGPVGSVGRTPWSVPRPFLLDMRAAEALGYRPVTDYASSIGDTCRSLIVAARAQAWEDAFPVLHRYPYPLFDYEAEDQVLAQREGAADVLKAP